MKIKNNNKTQHYLFLSILIFLSIIYVVPIFYNGIKFGDDTMFHLTRFEDFCKELQYGNYFPKIYSNSYNNYGYATGLFYPQLFLYPIAGLKLLGISTINCIFIYCVFFNCLTTCGYYLCFKTIFKMQKETKYQIKAFLFALLTFIDYYKYMNFYKRFALGELTALSFLPFVILGFYYILYKEKKYLMLGFSMACVAYAHNISLFLCSAALLILCIIKIKRLIQNRRIIYDICKSGIMAILLSSAYLFPMLEELQHSNLFVENNNSQFKNVSEHLLIQTNLPYMIGIIIILGLIISLFVFKNIYARFIESILMFLVIQSDLFPWELSFKYIKIMRMIQFPWRLCSFLMIPVIYYFIKILFNSKYLIKIGTTIVYFGFIISIGLLLFIKVGYCPNLHIQENEIKKYKNIGLLDFLPNDLAEYNRQNFIKPDNIIGLQKEYAIKQNPADYNEDNTMKIRIVKEKDVTNIHFSRNNKNPITVPVVSYKGYTVKLNNQKVDYYANRGFITIDTTASTGIISVEYTGTLTQKITRIISIICLFFCCLYDFQKRKGVKKND